MKLLSFFILALTLFLSMSASRLAYAEPPSGDSQVTANQSESTEADQKKVQKMLDETAAITKTLGSLQDDILKLGTDLQKAKDEELNVLRDQRRRKYAELRDELKGLVNNVVELEAAGRETREAKKVAAEVV